MIYKLKFSDKTEFAQAKNQLHLLQEYEKEYSGFSDFKEMLSVEEISEEKAKTIMLKNIDASTFTECPEISLFDLVCGDDFVIVGSTEWL